MIVGASVSGGGAEMYWKSARAMGLVVEARAPPTPSNPKRLLMVKINISCCWSGQCGVGRYGWTETITKLLARLVVATIVPSALSFS